MLGILGGTFDPIHYGHLNAAWHVYQTLDLNELRFMPCHRPPHRIAPNVSTDHRINMLKLAIQNIPGFVIDKRELNTDRISYTVDSLTDIRNEVGNTPICLLLGYDAFNQLATWHQPLKLIQLAHIVVVNRHDNLSPENDFIKELLTHEVNDPQKLKSHSAGFVYFTNNTQLDISATEIRKMFAEDKSPKFLLPDLVLDYIKKNNLYHPVIASA